MKIFLIANWKMNKNEEDAKLFCQNFISSLPSRALQYVLIAPPFTLLKTVLEAVSSTPIQVCAQNCHWEEAGAFTGEISPAHLKDLNICWTIIGHSERRNVFFENQEIVDMRLKGALKNKIKVIYCIGEKLEDREKGKTLEVIENQLKVLEDLKDYYQNIVIAYEPVWAIGTGVVARIEQIDEVHSKINKFYPTIPILYGGSVNEKNIEEIMKLKNVDGALVGGASLIADKFSEIVEKLLKAKGVL